MQNFITPWAIQAAKKLILVPLLAAALTWGGLSIFQTYRVKAQLESVTKIQRELITKQEAVIQLQDILIDRLEEKLQQRSAGHFAIR